MSGGTIRHATSRKRCCRCPHRTRSRHRARSRHCLEAVRHVMRALAGQGSRRRQRRSHRTRTRPQRTQRAPQRRRRSKMPAGGVRTEKYFGLAWDRQSCWIDSSLMALFFPDRMYKIMMPYIERCSNRRVESVRKNVLRIVQQLRTPGTVGELKDLRQQLLEFQQTRDQRNAFVPVNVHRGGRVL